MSEEGVEPSRRIAAHAPQACASASSATPTLVEPGGCAPPFFPCEGNVLLLDDGPVRDLFAFYSRSIRNLFVVPSARVERAVPPSEGGALSVGPRGRLVGVAGIEPALFSLPKRVPCR